MYNRNPIKWLPSAMYQKKKQAPSDSKPKAS